MNRTALILLPEVEPPQERAAFELWWQGATAVAFGDTDAATLPVPVERMFRTLFALRLWLAWRRIKHVVVAGPGAAALAAQLGTQHAAALPLRIA